MKDDIRTPERYFQSKEDVESKLLSLQDKLGILLTKLEKMKDNPRNTKAAEEIASKSAERLLKQANQQEHRDIASGVIELLAEGRVDDAYDLTYALLNCKIHEKLIPYLERDGKEIEEQVFGATEMA